ncbi:MAG: hypothetical protein ACREC0_00295 [Methylocella sp.]
MRKVLACSLAAFAIGGIAGSVARAQTAQQTFDSNMANANEVSNRMQQEQAHQATTQNGTSQYSGPTVYSSGVSGSPVVGYQRSTH